jgi:hypothetical protein
MKMLSQYLYGTETPDLANIVHRVRMRQKWWDATRTDSYGLRRNQHLPDTEASHATRDITSGRTQYHPQHARRTDATCKGHRRTTRITVQYLDYLVLVYHSDVLVVPMRACDLVHGLPWFHKHSWHRLGSIDSLRSPTASGAEEMTPMTTAVAL